MMRFTAIDTPFGAVGIVATEAGVCRLVLGRGKAVDMRRRLADELPDAGHEARLLPALQARLREYFAGKPVRFSSPLDLSVVTAFQRKVLTACAAIGYGQVMTYGELAHRIGRPQAARAVGHALGRNPVPLLIPCHRVIGSDGGLRGFSAEQGLALKRKLLELEGCLPGRTDRHSSG